MSSPVCLTEEIYRTAVLLLDEIDLQRPVRLLGITLSDLTWENFTPSLLPEVLRKERIQEALDGINDRFGEFTMAYGETVPDLRTLKVISPSWKRSGVKDSL